MVATLCWLQSKNFLSFCNFIAGYYYSMGIINLTDNFLTALSLIIVTALLECFNHFTGSRAKECSNHFKEHFGIKTTCI